MSTVLVRDPSHGGRTIVTSRLTITIATWRFKFESVPPPPAPVHGRDETRTLNARALEATGVHGADS